MPATSDHDLLLALRRSVDCFYYYRIIAPEDLIIQKLKVGRPRDFEDALTVLKRCRGILGRSYLLRWARRLRILKQMDYLFNVAAGW